MADSTDPTTHTNIETSCGLQLKLLSRIYAHITTPTGNSSPPPNQGMLPRLDDTWTIPVSAANMPASLQPDWLYLPWVQDMLSGFYIDTNPYRTISKEQLNVCVPTSSWSVVDSESISSLPGQAGGSQPNLVLPLTWSTTFDLTTLALTASICHALPGSPILVVYPGASGTGCYRCTGTDVMVSHPGLKAPVCQTTACDKSGTPDYRTIKGYPYITCLSGGCDDARCVEHKCPKATFTGPAGKALHADESWIGVPGRPLCTHCPEGKSKLPCTCPGQTQGCSYEYSQCTSSDYECLYGECVGNDWPCESDADCDVASGIGCSELYDKCYGMARCATNADCKGNKDSCVDGLCRQRCSTWGNSYCDPRASCQGAGKYPVEGECLVDKKDRTDESRYQCHPIGCSSCLLNAYCLDKDVYTGTPIDGTTFCPLGHTCITQGKWESSMCVLRPLLNDAGITTASKIGGMSSIMSNIQTMQSLLGKLQLPSQMGGIDVSNMKFKEKVKKGSLRMLPHEAGAAHQGYLALVMEMEDEVYGEVHKDLGRNAHLRISSPVAIRVRFQPYTYSGQLHAVPVDYGIYHYADDADPAKIEVGCTTKSIPPFGTVKCNKEETVEGHCTGTGSSKYGAQVSSVVDDSSRQSMVDAVDSILSLLTRSMVVGGWLFGRKKALDELDVARDSGVGPGTNYNADNDPRDEIQRLYIKGTKGQAGWAAVDYLER